MAENPTPKVKPEIAAKYPVKMPQPLPPYDSRREWIARTVELDLPQPWEGREPSGPITNIAALVQYLLSELEYRGILAAIERGGVPANDAMERGCRPVLRNAFRCLQKLSIEALPDFHPGDPMAAEHLIRLLIKWLNEQDGDRASGELSPLRQEPTLLSVQDLMARCPDLASMKDPSRRSWLCRFRKDYPSDFEELADAGGSQSRFMYRLSAVQSALSIPPRNRNAK